MITMKARQIPLRLNEEEIKKVDDFIAKSPVRISRVDFFRAALRMAESFITDQPSTASVLNLIKDNY